MNIEVCTRWTYLWLIHLGVLKYMYLSHTPHVHVMLKFVQVQVQDRWYLLLIHYQSISVQHTIYMNIEVCKMDLFVANPLRST